jgi:ATP-dependent exoDNAse (exonuclease V) alpha subunit
VPAGRAFWQAQQAGMHTSVLQETRRFDKATEPVKLALQDMKRGRFSDALSRLDTLEVSNDDLPAKVAGRYVANLEALKAKGIEAPKVGIVALTNDDRKDVNAAVHRALAERGHVASEGVVKQHLDDPKLTSAQRSNAGMLRREQVDRLIFRQRYRELGVDKYEVVKVVGYDVARNRVLIERQDGGRVWLNPTKHERFSPAIAEERTFSAGDLVEARGNLRVHGTGTDQVKNGSRGVVLAVDEKGMTVRWSDGRETAVSNDVARFIDHGYARTSFKEQGATNHREILAVSDKGAAIINRESTYVSGTRAKDNTEIVTSDRGKMLKNAGRDVSKLTALDPAQKDKSLEEILAGYRGQVDAREPAKDQERVKERSREQGFGLSL